MVAQVLLLQTLLACWAPTVAPVGGEAPDPAPEPAEPEGSQGGPAEGAPAHEAPEAPGPSPAAVAPQPTEPPPVWASSELPEAPFTAWTARAPLTLVGPGGVTVTVLRRLGVRVEVLQVLDGRMRVRCEGCEGGAAGTGPEGWLPLDAVRAADDHGVPDDALSTLLRQRAAWTGGRGLPAGAAPSALCELVDRGFLPIPGGRVQERLDLDATEQGRVTLTWSTGGWEVAEITGDLGDRGWSCRTTRPSQRGRGPAPR